MRYPKAIIYLPVFCFIAGCGGGGGSGSGDTIYGPDARYSFDETEGTIAFNSEFDAFHGNINGAARVAGVSGNALDFSGVDGSHVEFDICCFADPNTGEGDIRVTFPEDTFTIAAWLKTSAMSIPNIYPIFGGQYSAVQSMKMRLNNGQIDFLLYPANNGVPINLITSSFVLTNDEWVHVAITFDGAQARIYIDGEEDSLSSIIMPVRDIVNDYYVGGIPLGFSAGPSEHSFPGTIDDFFISQNALTQIEVQELMLSSIM